MISDMRPDHGHGGRRRGCTLAGGSAAAPGPSAHARAHDKQQQPRAGPQGLRTSPEERGVPAAPQWRLDAATTRFCGAGRGNLGGQQWHRWRLLVNDRRLTRRGKPVPRPRPIFVPPGTKIGGAPWWRGVDDLRNLPRPREWGPEAEGGRWQVDRRLRPAYPPADERLHSGYRRRLACEFSGRLAPSRYGRRDAARTRRRGRLRYGGRADGPPASDIHPPRAEASGWLVFPLALEMKSHESPRRCRWPGGIGWLE